MLVEPVSDNFNKGCFVHHCVFFNISAKCSIELLPFGLANPFDSQKVLDFGFILNKSYGSWYALLLNLHGLSCEEKHGGRNEDDSHFLFDLLILYVWPVMAAFKEEFLPVL